MLLTGVMGSDMMTPTEKTRLNPKERTDGEPGGMGPLGKCTGRFTCGVMWPTVVWSLAQKCHCHGEKDSYGEKASEMLKHSQETYSKYV
jgi:hypothetical protein